MRVNLIRHGATFGNAEKRYIGRTDEPLSTAGAYQILSRNYPPCSKLAVSPMRRCIETAELIYPGMEQLVCGDFRECDFGSFEGKNYIELSEEPHYRKWLETGSLEQFPGGERVDDFRERCVRCFLELTAQLEESAVLSMIVHGGTIMSILERLGQPERDFYGWHTDSGCGFSADWNGKSLIVRGDI